MESQGNSAKCRLLIQSQLRLTVLGENAVPCPKSGDPDAWKTWEKNQVKHRELLWANWLNTNRAVEFTLFWTTPGGTQTRSENLQKLSARKILDNVTVQFLPGLTHPESILEGFNRLLPKKGS